MSLDENIRYDVKNQNEGEAELLDSNNRLTHCGIRYIETEIVPLLEEALEKGNGEAVRIYGKLNCAAREYLDKKHHWKIMNLNGMKIM